MKISYKDSGVNIDEGNNFIEDIKEDVKNTFNKNVLGGIGSFSGAYAVPSHLKNPVVLGATDGVGTKLKLAIDSQRLDGIGIDLVAMCVNDLICNFGEPAFFLDYYATGQLDRTIAARVVKSIAKGCIEAECSLIGGETAEMPGMYSHKDFDLAGFAVGFAEKEDLNRSLQMKEGDKIVALPSSGLHSNGFSLVNNILFNTLKKDFNEDFYGRPLIEVLLEPTRIYVKTFKKIKDRILGLAHITGGGILENIPRIFPENIGAVIDPTLIKTPHIFQFLKNYMEESEHYRILNMGVGMVVIVEPKHLDFILKNTDGYVIGELSSRYRGVLLQ